MPLTNIVNPLSHEEWFRIVTSSMPSIAWATDKDLRFTWGMGAGLKMLGLRPNQLTGVSLEDYFQDKDPTSRPIRMHYEALAGRRVNYTQVWGDRLYHSYIEPLRDEAGEITGCVGISFDITESCSSLSIQGTSALNQLAFREGPLPMLVCDQASLTVELVNNQFLEATGLHHQQVAGEPLHSLNCWVDADELAPLGSIEPDGALLDGATCQMRRAGEDAQTRTAAYFAKAFELDGDAYLIITLDPHPLHDELNEASEKLANLEEFARVVPAMLYQIRGRNNSTEVFLDYVNPHISELTGLTPAAACDDVMCLIDSIHPDDIGRYYADALKATQECEPFEIEMRMVSQTGETRWVRAMSRPKAEGDFMTFYGVCMDIHDLKMREIEQQKSISSLSQLRHDEKIYAEQRSRKAQSDAAEMHRDAQRALAVNDLLRKTVELQEKEKRLVSYELHDGLVQDIVGASYTLQGMQAALGEDHPFADSLAKAIQTLEAATTEGRRLVGEMRPKTMEHGDLVKAVTSMIREEEASGGFLIEFNHNDPPELPPVVAAAAMRIIREGVTNARRHSGASSCRVMVLHTDNELSLTIEDEGKGFDVNSVPPGRYGLESIRERAKIFGGKTTIESEPGGGVRIHVQLPAELIESLA